MYGTTRALKPYQANGAKMPVTTMRQQVHVMRAVLECSASMKALARNPMLDHVML
jgi:hypothetical protein